MTTHAIAPTTRRAAGVLLLTLTAAHAPAQQPVGPERYVPLEWRLVGDPGNPSDSTGNGAVNKVFRIAAYEVTNAQYAQFLDSKARLGDPLELYNPEMETSPRGGIDRIGSGTSANPYRYVLKPGLTNKPVNFVSFFDALRFANWIAGGRGDADTETGTYTLLGGTPIPSNGDTVTREPGAEVFVPRWNEWYKAAHYDPAFGYHLYATGSNALPDEALATPDGEVANPGPNVVNYDLSADWGSVDGNVTTVGSAAATSHYGAYDMNGNVWEWNETIFEWQGNPYRVSNGGSFLEDESALMKTSWGIVKPWVEKDSIGFRLAARVQ